MSISEQLGEPVRLIAGLLKRDKNSLKRGRNRNAECMFGCENGYRVLKPNDWVFGEMVSGQIKSLSFFDFSPVEQFRGMVPIGGRRRIIGWDGAGGPVVDKGPVLTNHAARSRVESRCCAITICRQQHNLPSLLLCCHIPSNQPSLSLGLSSAERMIGLT